MILRDVMHKAIDSACDQATNLKAKVQIASAVAASGAKEVVIAGREKISEHRKALNKARMDATKAKLQAMLGFTGKVIGTSAGVVTKTVLTITAPVADGVQKGFVKAVE